MIGPSQRPLLANKQHSKETDIYAPAGFEPAIPARAAAEQRHRPRGPGIGVQLLRCINTLKPELNPICYLLALLGAHHFLYVSRIRVKLLTLR